MADAFIDTDVIVRLLARDDPRKAAEAADLFARVAAGALSVQAPDTVVADALYVLTSPRLYALPRAQAAAGLARLVALPGFVLDKRQVLLRALELYASTPARRWDLATA